VRGGSGARLITGFAGDQSRKLYPCSSVYTHTPNAFDLKGLELHFVGFQQQLYS